MDCIEVLRLFETEGIYLPQTDDVLKHVLDCKNPSCVNVKTGLLELLEAVIWQIRGDDEQAIKVFCESVAKINSAFKLFEMVKDPKLVPQFN